MKKWRYRKRKSSLSKFTQARYSLIAEEAPEFVKSYDDTGKLVEIDLLAYVGWLHACLKGFMTKMKARR